MFRTAPKIGWRKRIESQKIRLGLGPNFLKQKTKPTSKLAPQQTLKQDIGVKS